MKRYHSGQQFSNPYFKTVQQHWLWRNDRWAYAATTFLVILVVTYFAVQQRWGWITEVEISGNQYLTTDQLREPAWQVLHSRRWLILPQQFYFFASVREIESTITQQLTNSLALEELTITKHFPNKIVVHVQERVPGLTYILNDNYYYLDKEGIVTKQLANLTEADPHFPHVRDVNQRTVTVGQPVVATSMIDFIIQLNKTFTSHTQLNIAEYKLPAITCQKKTFVAEKLLVEEINNTEDSALKEQKKAILDRLQNKEITVDQSLIELEQLKHVETNTNATVTNNSTDEDFIAIKSQYVSTDCDYINVLKDVYIVTQEGPEIYFDSSLDMTVQYEHLVAVLNNKIENVGEIKYIDVRYPDKVYYK